MYEECLSPLKLSGFPFLFSLAPFGGQVSNISLLFTLIMNYFFTFVILLYNTFYGMVGWDMNILLTRYRLERNKRFGVLLAFA